MAIEIDHLGIAVRSLDEGLHFYEKILGMAVSHTETIAWYLDCAWEGCFGLLYKSSCASQNVTHGPLIS